MSNINIKKSIIYMTYYSKSSHVGTSLSIADILYTLYYKTLNVNPKDPKMPGRDKFILSKGHGSVALYATLAEKGFFDKDFLNRYYINGGLLPGHLDMEAVPGIELSTGSLGHGLSVGVGMAIANRSSNDPGQVYVLLGDGECNEGSVWEAIMLAATLKLNNLTAIVDYNKLQGLGQTNQIINQENMADRWKAFGWETYEVNGHRIEELEEIFNIIQKRPKVVIAHTTKGKGVSFMENQLEWHYRSPNF
jgi:transketolase